MTETTQTTTTTAKPEGKAKTTFDPKAPTRFQKAAESGAIKDDGDPERGSVRREKIPDASDHERKSDEYLRNIIKKESGAKKAKREDEARQVAAEQFIDEIVPGTDDDLDDDPKPAPAKERAKGKTTAEVAEEDEDEETRAEDADDEVDDPELEKARKEARRVLGKSADSILSKLEPDEIKALAKHQAKISREVNERLEQAKAIAEGGTKKDAQSTAEGKVTDPLDLEALVQPFVEVYGDEAKEPLQKVLTPVIQALKGHHEYTRRMEAFGFELALETVRGGLRAEFPQTKDDDEWARVVDSVETLIKTGKYTGQGMKGLPKLVRQAAAIVYADELQASARRKAKNADEAERYGGLELSERANQARKPMTAEEKDRAIGMAIVRGVKGEDALKRINRGR